MSRGKLILTIYLLMFIGSVSINIIILGTVINKDLKENIDHLEQQYIQCLEKK